MDQTSMYCTNSGSSTDVTDARKVHKLQADLHTTTLRLQAVQRNYDALSRVIRDKQQQVTKMSTDSDTREAMLIATQQQLVAMKDRAEAAERIVKQQAALPGQVAALQQQLAALHMKTHQEQQQQQTTTEQLQATMSELSAVHVNQANLQQQLTETEQQLAAVRIQLAQTREHLESEHNDKLAAHAQLNKLKESTAQARAQFAAAQDQVAEADARTATAEKQLAAERAAVAQVTEELATVKRAQASVSLKLLELQGSHLQLQEELTATRDKLSQRETKVATLQQQVLELQGQAYLAIQRADITEDARRELDMTLRETQDTLTEALTARATAVEKEAAAEARARQASDRIEEVERERDHQKAVAAQEIEELEKKLSIADSDMRGLKQRIASTRYSRIEATTHLLLRVNAMEERLRSVTTAADEYASALDAAAEEADAVREEQLQRMMEWEDWATEALDQGAAVQELVETYRQQVTSRQLQIRSLERECKELHLEVLNQERALSTATIELRTTKQQLNEALAAREKDAAQASGSVLTANSAAAQAADEAARARAALQQQQMMVCKLETELAAAQADAVSAKGSIVMQEVDMVTASAHLGSASSQLKAVAAATAQLLTMLQTIDLLQQKEVAVAVLQLEAVSGISSRPGSRAASAGSAAAAAAAAGGAQEAEGAKKPSYTLAATSSQLEKGLEAVERHVQLLVSGMRQMSQQYPQLTGSWQESERKLVNSLAQLVHLEQSLASNYTCLLCMGVFQSPVAVIPCGHTYCQACLSSQGGCRECGGGQPDPAELSAGHPHTSSVTSDGGARQGGSAEGKENAMQWVPVPVLDRLCAKHEVKLGALTTLQALLAERQLQVARPASSAPPKR